MEGRTPQERILEELERLTVAAVGERSDAGDVGCELVRQAQWANTGWVGIARPGDVVPERRLRYDFQSDYATFAPVDGTGPTFYLAYRDGPEAVYDQVVQVFAWLAEPVAVAYR